MDLKEKLNVSRGTHNICYTWNHYFYIYWPNKQDKLVKKPHPADTVSGRMLHMEQNESEKPSRKQIGAWGEQITVKNYQNSGFKVLGVNYLKKWGEIDVITKKDNIVHFIEVKTVSYGTKADLERAVTHGTWRPEENVTAHKVKKLSRAIESWLGENKWDGKWQIDVVAVRIVPRETFATIKVIDNVILG